MNRRTKGCAKIPCRENCDKCPFEFEEDGRSEREKEKEKCTNVSTAVACDNLKRGCIGIEIDPKWYEVAQRRINEPKQISLDFTGGRNGY